MDEMVSFEEQLYREMVDRAFKGNDPRSFSNGKPEHAAYLIGRFFDHAKSTIRLYCGSLARALNGVQVYASSDVIGSALDFLWRPDTRLLIVLENEIDVQSIEVDSRKVIASATVNDVSQSQTLARFFDQVLVERNNPAVWEHPTKRAAERGDTS